MELKVKRLTDTAKLPTKAHNSDAGWDVYADEDIEIRPGETVKVKTGIAVQVDPGETSHETIAHLIWDRSSLGSKGIHRLAGVADLAYTGELVICLTNLNTFPYFNSLRMFLKDPQQAAEYLELDLKTFTYQIKRGDKIAQVLTQRVCKVHIMEVDSLEKTERGSKGFGSSDAKSQSTL